MRILSATTALALVVTAFLTGCGTPERTPPAQSTFAEMSNAAAPRRLLRVGITTNYPPMIFRQRERILGVEADLARQLGIELDREVVFVPLTWSRQIPKLLAGETDIIMSGMTITNARRVRIAFSEPYFRSGLFAMMRTEDAGTFDSRERILNASAAVGVIKGTTGDVFVQQNIPRARKWEISAPVDAPFALTRYKIDLFIFDGPAVTWIASENEADVTALFEALNEEYLGWGMRPQDHELIDQVNTVLQRWKANGTLMTVLKTWLPYLWGPE